MSIDDDEDSRDPNREERAAGRDDARRLGGRVRARATGNAVDAARVRAALECEAWERRWKCGGDARHGNTKKQQSGSRAGMCSADDSRYTLNSP